MRIKKSTEKVNRGRRFGLNVRQTWIKLFQENLKKKLSDEQLHKLMRSEFPNHDSKEITKVTGVRSARNAYNRGYYTEGHRPSRPTPQFIKGQPVEFGIRRKKFKLREYGRPANSKRSGRSRNKKALARAKAA